MERTVTRHAIRLARLQPRPLSRTLHRPLRQQHLRQRSDDSKNKDDQVYPLTGYYADILSSRQKLTDAALQQPAPETSPQTSTPTSEPSTTPTSSPSPPTPATKPKDESLTATKEATLAKARIVFGSSGSSRRDPKDSSLAKTIAGITVPPKPKEPSGDDCCMSGCVNCVWDIYREEFEEWKAASKSARDAMEAQKAAAQQDAMPGPGADMGASMDDDGGGSEALWMEEDVKGAEEAEKDPFADVPVGIREFMRTEKMLKERQAAAQQSLKG